MTKLFFLPVLFLLPIAVSGRYDSGQAVAPPTASGTTPPTPSSAAQEFLDAHNKARAEVGVGPLKWSIRLANATSLVTSFQRDEHNCSFFDFSNMNITVGILQLLFRGSIATPPQEVVDVWVAEKKFYNYATNTCMAGQDKCFSYTQVVWKNSLELGCAQATCLENNTTLTICFYNPRGNVIGEKPY